MDALTIEHYPTPTPGELCTSCAGAPNTNNAMMVRVNGSLYHNPCATIVYGAERLAASDPANISIPETALAPDRLRCQWCTDLIDRDAEVWDTDGEYPYHAACHDAMIEANTANGPDDDEDEGDEGGDIDMAAPTPTPLSPTSAQILAAAAETMTNRLARQTPLKLVVPREVGVIGCGGVGTWLAIFLAMAGVPKLWLWDGDTVSETNLNRLPLPTSAVGRSKSEMLAEHIRLLRPDCDIFAMPRFSVELAQDTKFLANWVGVSTDTLASRQLVYEWCRSRRILYIEAAAEGEYGSITSMPAEWSTADEASPGYASVPVHVGPCVMAAGAAAYHILHNCLANQTTRMGWRPTSSFYGGMDFIQRPE